MTAVIPPEAVTAAAGAICDRLAAKAATRDGFDLPQYANQLAVCALEAAEPFLTGADEARRDERERIRKLAIEHEATYVRRTRCQPGGYPPATYVNSTERPFADLLGGDRS